MKANLINCCIMLYFITAIFLIFWVVGFLIMNNAWPIHVLLVAAIVSALLQYYSENQSNKKPKN